jgi:hypothetical protein
MTAVEPRPSRSLEEHRAKLRCEVLKVFDKGSPGQVLTNHDVVTCAQMLAREREPSRRACRPEDTGSSPQRPSECLMPSTSRANVIGTSGATASANVDFPDPGAPLINTSRATLRRYRRRLNRRSLIGKIVRTLAGK